ncbi:MAG TPA: tetraacyldisaccharide 4'-kinase [Oculatellaceae cyanobacterium]
MTTAKSSNNSTHYSPQGALRTLLMPAAVTYGAGSLVRVMAYATGIIPRYKAPVPVLSLGNLTLGGTGKTPIAIDLARKLVMAGFRPAVLSRGYKRKSKDDYVVVSDGSTILASCEDSGDEPFLIASSVKGAVVIVGASRVQTAEVACNELACNVIVLDDAFQHLKIKRDADIVLWDYNDDIEQQSLLPAGRLREPLAALNRASSVVITKVPQVPDPGRLERFSRVIHQYNRTATIGLVRFNANKVVTFDDSHVISTLANSDDICSLPARALAFCGLARPEPFYAELQRLNVEIVDRVSFGDHHWYSESDVSRLNERASRHNAAGFITTEKDIVKFFDLKHHLSLPLHAIGLSTEWIGTPPDAMQEILAKGPR